MKGNNIEDIYLASPLQEGLLFETLNSPDGSVYFQQLKFRFEGPIDLPAWQAAWDKVIDRHQILRTALVWQDRERPLQVVMKRVKVPWQILDWRGLAAAEQQEQFAAFLKADRKQGFDFSRAPLLRMTLIRLSDQLSEFICSHHHVLLDGWSTGIVLKELLSFYQTNGGAPPVLPRSRPYKDFIAWLERQDLSKAEDFWRESLKGFNSPTVLPASSVNGTMSGDETQKQLDVYLDAETTARLQSFARANSITLNTIVTAAWALLLSRYSDATDVVFGITVSGRPETLEGVQTMVGLFINTLPFRVQLPPDSHTIPWLTDLQLRLLDLREYEFSPLVRVHGWSEVPRGVALFESMVVFDNYPGELTYQGLKRCGLSDIRSIESASFPLGLVAAPGPRLFLRIAYDSHRFETSAIERMMGHLRVLLNNMVANPQARLSDIAMFTDDEQRRMLVSWNDTKRDYPAEVTLPELFEEQAVSSPDALAVIAHEDSLTYRELNERSNKLAHYLRGKGIGPESRVALCIERSSEMIVSLLGVLKAGAAYVPLDHNHPAERFQWLLHDSGASLLLTQPHLLEKLPAVELEVLSLDHELALLDGQSVENVRSSATADNLAYVIYTSGSTGRPRAVMIPHRGICNTLIWRRETFGLTSADRLLSNLHYSFDASVWQIFGPLISGATLVLCKPSTYLDSSYLVEKIITDGITITDFIPSALQVFLDEPEIDRCRSLRHVFSGGEALTSSTRDKFFAHLDASLHNVYGPTETSVDAAYWTCGPDDKRDYVPIGRPIANKRLYLLDDSLRIVPIGVTGEIYIGGGGLSRGYSGLPGLTAEKFVPDPFSLEPGARLYRTGDLGRYQSDGAIEHVGRVDNQVKLRGFRIELNEIEATLELYKDVRNCVVVVREDAPGDRRLVAYVVGRKRVLSPRDLRQFLEGKLPSYMLPATIVLIDKLPLTLSGKVDRRALPAPEAMDLELDGFAAPRNQIEDLLAEVWAQLLGVKRVSIHDNFFALGGHSLLAARVVSRVREAFKTEIPMRALFEHPTIGSLAEVVEAAMKDEQGLQAPPITTFPRHKSPPMSFAQQRLWFIDRLVPGNAFYNMLGAFCLHGRLNVEALEGALNDLIERHEILRTTFAEIDAELVQVIQPQSKLSLTLIDLTGYPAHQREAETYLLAAKEGEQPFDLTRGPLVRARLARLTDEDHRLFLTMHHIVGDGWSLGVLLGELATFYNARAAGVPASLPQLAIQYADYAAWQQRWLQGEVLANQMDYWRRQLHGAPTLLQLPSDHPRGSTQSFKGAIHSFTVSSITTESLRRLCREETATMFMVLLAAFDVLLSRYSGQEDILVGTPVAGRNRSEFERLIGFFINTLVLRTNLAGNPTFRELVGRVREISLGAYSHQDLPFEKIVEELHPQRDMSHTPVFQVMFSLQNAPADTPAFPELTIRAMEVDSGTSKFDLSLDLQEASNGLLGWFEFSTDLFTPEYIARMTGHFLTLLESIAQNPDQKIGVLTLLTEGEQRQLLLDWNTTAVAYATNEPFNLLFEQQVERTPDAIAVVCGPRQLTYAELNQRANILARLLIEQGIGAESVVGVFMRRDINLLTSILGILKAGGAYLPLDPAYPVQRQRTIVAQSGARLVFATAECLPKLDEICNSSEVLTTPAVLVVEDALRQQRETQNLPTRARPDNLAYIIYTSGSTGVPKGVMIHHRGMVNHLWANIEALSMTSLDVLAQTASHCFDISVWQFLAPLIIGGRVQIFPDEITQDPTRLLSAVDGAGVTVFETVPSLLQVALDDMKTEKQKRPELKSLRWLLPTGEEVPVTLCREWLRTYPSVPLMNAYGPSECSDDVALAPIYEPPDETVSRVSIGRPVANLQVAIVDKELNLVPIGVPGELCVRGIGVGRGYLSLPPRTASVFVPDPFSTQPGARMYRSGDRAKYLPDGSIEFLGRMDHQVKVRGHRIELGEVEAALSQVPGVSDAVVIVRDDTPGDKRLVAYYTCGKEVVTTADLRDFLEQQMPNYMIPSLFVLLDAMPLSANGKIDRQSLPAPDLSQSRQDSYVAPRDNVEIKLCEIWEQLLKVSPIGIKDNFFSVGGHSLLALRFIAEVQQHFQRTLPLAVLFERGTIKELAKMLREQIASPESSLVAIQPQGERPPVFFVHVGSGNVLCYLDLARHLGSDQPFYAIQDPSLLGTMPPFESLEAMAAHYVECVRGAQASGPYLIGGWSFGGLVAFEMSRQLIAAGEQVSLLAILDSGTPEMEREFERHADDAALLAILAHEMYLPVVAAELRQLEPEQRLHFVADYMNRAGLIFDDAVDVVRGQLEIFKYRNRATQGYDPGPYAGSISLFVAGDRQPDKEGQAEVLPDLIEGWRKLALGGLEVLSVPGAHHEIGREPNVQVLAKQLRSCIDRALESDHIQDQSRCVSLNG